MLRTRFIDMGRMGLGKIYLVGAGPGDPELLTLKAVRVLAAADVVIVDALVNREALQFANPNARVVEAGKRGGCKSTSQTFIHRQMIAAARAGKTVVRLKGGDPFVFGRGGEELEALRAADIPVEIVSGVTAGIGVPAMLGIPLTHRDFCQGVTFVTGHTQGQTQPNWAALVKSATTLVIYMGVTHIDAIAACLIEAGLSGATPVAIIENGTLPEQRSLVCHLASLAERVKQERFGSPAIVVIGKVVSMAQRVQESVHASRAA